MSESPSQQARIASLVIVFTSVALSGLYQCFVDPILFAVGSEPPPDLSSLRREPGTFKYTAVRTATTADELKAAISSGHCILFVDSNLSLRIAMFREPYISLTDWCSKVTEFKAVRVVFPPDTTDELWHAVQQLWADNSIPPGLLKNYGGAGCVVWFRDGVVTDYG